MLTILFTRHYEMLGENHTRQIKEISEDLKIVVSENVLDIIPDVDILIAGTFNREVLEKARKLKWVHTLAAGVDRLLFPEFVDSPIILTNSSGVHPIPISEHVLGMMLMFSRKLDESVKNQLKKEWERPLPQELYGKTLGIVGFGSIGERVGHLGKCFGMHVLGLKRDITYKTEDVDELLPPERLDDLLSRSDFVVVAVPFTKDTKNLISEKEMNLMKKTAYLINIARGKIIDQNDLIKVLEQKRIAGAGLDVFEEEPLPSDNPLWRFNNVILTPHYAGSTPEYFNRAITIFCDNLKRFLKGEPMLNVIDKKRGY